ncbi:VOC family protein [Aliamphritea hakodatensis]|uniref:VOC family protein n=1 Tax=Aliamphritea hakodatensis TaxID=2895352 RepID=UPI0022FDA7A1|nr:VOC family protein [Aliamphritea hakodatensis]
MRHIHKHSLQVANLARSTAFYQACLGMVLVSQYQQQGQRCCLLGYVRDSGSTPPTLLELIENEGFKRLPGTLPAGYWKIALAVADVDIARACLTEKGIEVTPARQVPDVAYLCHLNDPDGHCVELIQHHFEANHRPGSRDNRYPLGGEAVFSLITYRVKNPQASVAFYEQLGMRLLSRQDVEFAGFTLYFLGYSDEVLPEDDVCAVGNREWLWQRPYTLIELQHNWGTELQDAFAYDVSADTGFAGIELVTNEAGLLALTDQTIAEAPVCFDPDGYRIDVRQICVE